MPGDPKIRASDNDRDRAAALLREHHAAGRLTAEEFNERLDQVYQARTVGELDELLSDLPAIDLYRLPDAGLPRYRGGGPGSASYLAGAGPLTPQGRFSSAWAAAWGSWLTLTLVSVTIWAIGGGGSPWFLWVAGPYGAILLARWLSGGHPRRASGPHRPEIQGGDNQPDG